MPTTQHTDVDIDQCIAQARKWAASPDNGWTPSREQVAVLADEVERLRAERTAQISIGLEDGDVIGELGGGRRLLAIEHGGPGQIVYVPSGDPMPMHLPSADLDIDDMLDDTERRELGALLRRIQEQLDAAEPDRLARALTVELYRSGHLGSIASEVEDAVRAALTAAWAVTR